MPETKLGPKSLYVLAKALGRWDDEGGAPGSSPETNSGPDLALHAAEERMLRCLGSAVILQWNELPTEMPAEALRGCRFNDSLRLVNSR